MNINLRLKWWKNYTFNMNAVFATYAYDPDEQGNPYVGTHTEWSRGRFGRFQGMSQNLSFTLTPEKLAKLFGGKSDDDEKDSKRKDHGTRMDWILILKVMWTIPWRSGKTAAKKKSGKAKTDSDGYMAFKMPWSLTLRLWCYHA